MTLVVTDLTAPGIDGLTLRVGAGEIVGLAGHDTSRTHAVQAIAGLERVRSGSVSLAGVDVTGEAPDRIAGRGLSYVPAGRRIFRALTVEENLALGAYRVRRDRAQVASGRERAYMLFPRLADRRTQLAGTLSGGEQQMLVVARGLMTAPLVLLLDEPSAGLGPPAIEALAGALGEIRATGTAVLLADEGLRLVRPLADRILVLEDGRAVAVAADDPRLGTDYLR
jgi:branched-chain amino acid transport system ATP-binding protein